MWAYIGVLLLPLIIFYSVIQGGAAAYVRYHILQEDDKAIEELRARILSIQVELNAVSTARDDESEWELERRLARMQGIRQMLQNSQAQLQAIQSSPITISRGVLMTTFEALALPTADVSETMITSVPFGGTMRSFPYIAPRELIVRTLDFRSEDTWNFYDTRSDTWLSVLRDSARNARHILAAFLGLPLTFILLPVSRRRARVRWAHLGRVWMYSAFIPLTMLYLAGGAFAVAMWFPPLDDLAHGLFTLWIPVIIPWALLGAFWTFAIRNYLKMPHALLIVILMSAVAVLITMGALFWIGGVIIW